MNAVAIVGPTASGKSALAMAVAARYAVEIISLDSAQVYRDMDIGTAKPGAAERAAVPHHLIDIIDPTERYSAARFRAEAFALLDAITRRGRTPLLVGGTMLYYKALTEGLAELPDADAAVRTAIDRAAAERGWPALHAELARIDPETAARVAPGDAQRIQRALEIHRVSGRPMSAWLRDRAQPARLPITTIALVPNDRSALHERIATRFDAMLAAGLVDEVVMLKRKYRLDPSLPSMRSVGYRQVWDHLAGAYDRRSLRDKGIFATRQFAKRQLTWLRALPGLVTFDCFASDLLEHALGVIGSRAAERP